MGLCGKVLEKKDGVELLESCDDRVPFLCCVDCYVRRRQQSSGTQAGH